MTPRAGRLHQGTWRRQQGPGDAWELPVGARLASSPLHLVAHGASVVQPTRGVEDGGIVEVAFGRGDEACAGSQQSRATPSSQLVHLPTKTAGTADVPRRSPPARFSAAPASATEREIFLLAALDFKRLRFVLLSS